MLQQLRKKYNLKIKKQNRIFKRFFFISFSYAKKTCYNFKDMGKRDRDIKKSDIRKVEGISKTKKGITQSKKEF